MFRSRSIKAAPAKALASKHVITARDRRLRETAAIRRASMNQLRSTFARQPSEYKHVDVTASGTLNATTSIVTFLNGVATGAGFYQRVGNRVTPVWCQLGVTLFNNSATAKMARIMLVIDQQPPAGGAPPTIDEIVQDVSNAGVTSQPVFGGRNTNQTARFRTLLDRFVFLIPTTIAGQSVIMHEIRFIRGYQQAFRGATAGLADVSTGALYSVIYSDSAAAPDTINYNVVSRYRYTDN